ncbi:peptidoglycan DD-metalloendopeptidase family protein [Acetobacterium bakii]|uniref:peptidoglycan DD-metalloendopeptidase family protein n=1 Tax=Acetobacterium bakii TaxID=52689 RepID=UPI000680C424|nr:peptidoglycan DD-metalloendopeptidase family protein [Acetobacterium bakii]
MAVPVLVKAAAAVATDKNLRNIALGVIAGLLGLIFGLILTLVYILTTPITMLSSIITNPEILAEVLSLKSEYQYLLPGKANGSGQYAWPLDAQYKLDRSDETNLFGERVHPIYGDIRMHTGIDIQAPNGSNIYAIGDGMVVFAGMNGGWGNTIILDVGKTKDGKTITAHYCHLTTGSWSLNAGDAVKRGQQLALTGATGSTQGGHIHFEIKADGQYVDPMLYISDSDAAASGEIDLGQAQQVNAQITAYCDYGTTSSGTTTAANRTVAGYPSLEAGTRIYIALRADQPNGGVYVVEDRGGAVDEERKVIDMWLPTEAECLSWGRQYLPIYIIQEDSATKKQRIVDLGGYDYR